MSADTGTAKRTRSEAATISYLAFLGVLLATGIDIALPAFTAIEEGLDGASNTSLVVTMYIVGMALGQLVYGPIADRFGRQPAILSGLALYAIGAVLSALAPTFGVLLAARLVWGLGAAAPAGLRAAITRDLYSGDAMARVTTIMMAVFLLGPVFMPLIGEALLQVAPWRAVFWFSSLLAFVGAAWCLRFGETLDVERRRPLEFSKLTEALKEIVRTRVTLGHLAANVFLSGAFFIFLGSSQPVFDRVFDRRGQFALLFAVIGVVTIPALLLNNRLLGIHGSRRMSVVTSGASALIAIVGIVLALAADGRPNFWLWYVWLTLVTSLLTLATPAIQALALEPMGELAGTASALMYFTGFAFGAGLAAIFDALVESSVTPFVVGFAVYASIGFVLVIWSRPLALEREPT